MNILVTGANGQLGNEMRCIAATSLNNYIFTDVAELDITDLDAIRNMIHLDNIKVIVNCAAYTNVDKAEDDYDMADLLNNKAVENLSISALENPMTLEYSFPLISLATPAPTLDARKPTHTEVTAIRSAMATILRPAAHRYLV